MTHQLSVLIPCKNEGRNMRACLASVADLADELLVADSGSTDDTKAIAAEFGARIIEREYVNSADFKNWAIPQARHEWVLIVDADERVTPDLAADIRRTLASPRCDGYRIPRRSYVFGYPIRYSGWQSDTVLRLFRRDLSRYEAKWVHADVLVSTGNVGKLAGAFVHYTGWSYDETFEKLGRYTSWSAQDLHARGKRATGLDLLFRPPARFFRQYLLRQGFRDGIPGLIVCTTASMSVFIKYAKLWVMQHGRSQSETLRDER